MNEIAFLTISLSICVFGLLTVLTPHVFHGAVWLSLCLISVSGIYFFLDASFVGVIQVLVYIGGIITLFIFATGIFLTSVAVTSSASLSLRVMNATGSLLQGMLLLRSISPLKAS